MVSKTTILNKKALTLDTLINRQANSPKYRCREVCQGYRKKQIQVWHQSMMSSTYRRYSLNRCKVKMFSCPIMKINSSHTRTVIAFSNIKIVKKNGRNPLSIIQLIEKVQRKKCLGWIRRIEMMLILILVESLQIQMEKSMIENQ